VALLVSSSMLNGFEQIESNAFLDFGADPDRSIVLLVRKATGQVTAVEIERMLRGVMLTLGEPRGWSILFDTRAAVGRNGPEFEAEVARLREYMLTHYRRVAVLVRSVIGEMQVQRMLDKKARMLVFRDVEQALGFLVQR
jgi:hypothetical protein